MRDRWDKHTADIQNIRWTVCGLTRHFGDHHQGEIVEETMPRLEIKVVDRIGRLEDLQALEDKWMCDPGYCDSSPGSF